MNGRDTCKHGVEGTCMLCIREGEGKPTPKEERRGPAICPDCGDPITYPHPGCGDREHGP